MYYALAVFRSRTHTRTFAEKMKLAGVYCSIVQTPPDAGVGCGVSAKFYRGDLDVAVWVLKRCAYYSFAGFYDFYVDSVKYTLKRIKM